jgi:hypothetical protein
MRAHKRLAREWTDQDDALLAAILSLRERWDARGGRLTLPDLELETTLVTLVVSGLCPRHGQFVTEWTGRKTDPFPLEARCPAGDRGRCHETSPVYVLV